MSDWVTGVFCPVLGVVIANFMFATPTKEVRAAQLRRDLGALNPIPFGVTVIDCVGWTIYGCMKRDIYLYWSVMPGLVLSVYFCTTTMSLLMLRNQGTDSKIYFQMELMVVGGALFWCIIGLIVSIILSPAGIEHEYALNLVGSINATLSLLYYASPASTALLVIRTRNSSSLYAPLIVMNLVNATLWFFYGLLGANDIYIWGPNTAGISFAVLQLTLVVLFPKKVVTAEQCRDVEHVGIDTFSSLSTTINIISQLSEQQVVDAPIHDEYIVANEAAYLSLSPNPDANAAPPSFNPILSDLVPTVENNSFGEALQPMEISTCT